MAHAMFTQASDAIDVRDCALFPVVRNRTEAGVESPLALQAIPARNKNVLAISRPLGE